MATSKSSAVSPGQDALASQYNDLRDDVLDAHHQFDNAQQIVDADVDDSAGIKGSKLTHDIIPVLPASDPTSDNEATRKSYVDTREAKQRHGTSTRTSTGTQTIAHGLGKTPKMVQIFAEYGDGKAISIGTYTPGGGNSCIALSHVVPATSFKTDKIVSAKYSSYETTAEVTSLDSTNITLSWATTAPAFNVKFFWTAFAGV